MAKDYELMQVCLCLSLSLSLSLRLCPSIPLCPSPALSHSLLLQAGVRFATQLRMIKGCSTDKAAAIVQRFRSARELFLAYEQCTSVNNEKHMLAEITAGLQHKQIGANISAKIWQFFRDTDYSEKDLLKDSDAGEKKSKTKAKGKSKAKDNGKTKRSSSTSPNKNKDKAADAKAAEKSGKEVAANGSGAKSASAADGDREVIELD